MNQTSRSESADVATARERVLAYLADFAVVGPALAAAVRRQGSLGGRLAAALAVANLYHILLEGTWGRTVGKRLVGIRVAGDGGEPCTYWAATVRTLLRFVDWLPAGYLAAFVSMACTERRRRLGDLVAGTVVVRDGDREARQNG